MCVCVCIWRMQWKSGGYIGRESTRERWKRGVIANVERRREAGGLGRGFSVLWCWFIAQKIPMVSQSKRYRGTRCIKIISILLIIIKKQLINHHLHTHTHTYTYTHTDTLMQKKFFKLQNVECLFRLTKLGIYLLKWIFLVINTGNICGKFIILG